MTHTIDDDLTVNIPADGANAPPSRLEILLTDAFIALAPAIVTYDILHIFVYTRTLPPWTPRAAAVIAWLICFAVALFAQATDPSKRT